MWRFPGLAPWGRVLRYCHFMNAFIYRLNTMATTIKKVWKQIFTMQATTACSNLTNKSILVCIQNDLWVAFSKRNKTSQRIRHHYNCIPPSYVNVVVIATDFELLLALCQVLYLLNPFQKNKQIWHTWIKKKLFLAEKWATKAWRW